jgi:hypothetical protein
LIDSTPSPPRAGSDLRRNGIPPSARPNASVLDFSDDDMPVLIEWLWTWASTELLRPIHASKTLQRRLSSSERVREFQIEATVHLMPSGGSNFVHRGRIRPKPIGDVASGWLYLFMIRLRSFSVAALTRFAVTASRTSPL